MNRAWLAVLAAALAAAGTARGAEKGPPGRGSIEAEKVVVESSTCAAFGPVEPLMLRKILKWCEGDLWLPGGGRCVAKLVISRVVSGELKPGEAKAQQGGLRTVKVYVVNDAALALAAPGAKGAGVWRLGRIRGGGLIVSDVEDTPFGPEAVRGRKEALASAAKELESGDAALHIRALDEVRLSCPFHLVPKIIDLCWDQGYVISPGAKAAAGGPKRLRPQDIRVVGEEARRALSAVTKPLSHHGAPKFAAGRQAFREWWKDLSSRDPSGQTKLEIRIR